MGVLALLNRKDRVTPDVEARRALDCQMCGFHRGIICAKCGCVVRLKIKVRSETCPDGRWRE